MAAASPERFVPAEDMPTEIVVHAPAKLNLSLGVVARRPDGFHEIDSLMVAVTLHDTLRVRPRPEGEGIVLRVWFDGRLASPAGRSLARDVPDDDRNLVVRAARALAEATGVRRGLAIDLVKRVPAQAGLGGGSSDAAAVLHAAVEAWQLDVDHALVSSIAAGIGSDVPWFLTGGAGIARGRGERIEPVTGIPAWPVVIAVPAGGLSTAAVYAGCVPEPTTEGRSAVLAKRLAEGSFQEALPLMHNTLQAAAVAASPEVARLLAAMQAAGAVRPLVTGSGSGCFALARTSSEARAIAARLDVQGWPGVFSGRFQPVSGSVDQSEGDCG
jgi:4-diphosphocytidyl-2-C-methyl-D-erythritol kinase